MSLILKQQKKYLHSSDDKMRKNAVIRALAKLYPDAECELTHHNPFELLISTILSAQCTDARVNMVTPALFKKYPTARKMAVAEQSDIEHLIRSTGFFRNKAKSILCASQKIVEKHGGQVPMTMDELVALPGVGRKTANVVLGNAFGKNEGVVVDTHVSRLSQRLGFTKQKDPVKIESDLMSFVPKTKWTLWSHWLIWHGRRVCKAINPKCDVCELKRYCPSRRL